MNLIFYTSEESLQTSFTKYYLEQIAVSFPEVIVISVRGKPAASTIKNISNKIKLLRTKKRMWNWLYFIEFFMSYPIRLFLSSKDQNEIDLFFNTKITGRWQQLISNRVVVKSVNGINAVTSIENYNPDIILQAGAGLLKSSIINIPKIAVINIHHGIAPLLRGMDSIYWAKWKRKNEWLGATIHLIDEGIDTGTPLKYIYPQQTSLQHHYSELFGELSVNAIKELKNILIVLQNTPKKNWGHEKLKLAPSTYKSSFSGLRMLLLYFFEK